jgi:hypothetical protein
MLGDLPSIMSKLSILGKEFGRIDRKAKHKDVIIVVSFGSCLYVNVKFSYISMISRFLNFSTFITVE